MMSSINIAKRISKDLGKNFKEELEDINCFQVFSPLFNLGIKLSEVNLIICFIIYAYDNDSQWLNLKQDRYDNKVKIMKGLGADFANDIFSEILDNENTHVNSVIIEYLIEQTTWKWHQIMSLIDQHQTIMRFVNQKTEEQKKIEKMSKEGAVVELNQEYGDDAIGKILKIKNELLTQGVQIRRDADNLLSEIRKEFVLTEHAVQQDFQFNITDEKKINPESWRDFIRERNRKKQLT